MYLSMRFLDISMERHEKELLRLVDRALAREAQLIGTLAYNRKDMGLILGGTHIWVVGLIPWPGIYFRCTQEATDRYLSLTSMLFPLSLLL